MTVSNQHVGFPEEQALDDYYGRKFDILDLLNRFIMIYFCSISCTHAERTDIELQSNPEMTYFPSDTAEGIK